MHLTSERARILDTAMLGPMSPCSRILRRSPPSQPLLRVPLLGTLHSNTISSCPWVRTLALRYSRCPYHQPPLLLAPLRADTLFPLRCAPAPAPALSSRASPPAAAHVCRLPLASAPLAACRTPGPPSARLPRARLAANLRRVPPLGPPARLAPSTTAPSHCRPPSDPAERLSPARSWARCSPAPHLPRAPGVPPLARALRRGPRALARSPPAPAACVCSLLALAPTAAWAGLRSSPSARSPPAPRSSGAAQRLPSPAPERATCCPRARVEPLARTLHCCAALELAPHRPAATAGRPSCA
jgi:hypothetical protein